MRLILHTKKESKVKKILISIHPNHVDNIINKIKRYEYRTRVAKDDIESIIVYSTYPKMKVVAEVKIEGILSETPDVLWDMTSESSGIDKKYFDEYFKNRKKAYAYQLGEVIVFKEPKELSDFGVNHAPQSYVYIR